MNPTEEELARYAEAHEHDECWCYGVSVDLGALVTEVRRLRHNEEKWRAATGAVVGHAQCPPGSVCRETS